VATAQDRTTYDNEINQASKEATSYGLCNRVGLQRWHSVVSDQKVKAGQMIYPENKVVSVEKYENLAVVAAGAK